MDEYTTSLLRRIERLEDSSTQLSSMISSALTLIKNLQTAIADIRDTEKINATCNLNTLINTLKVREQLFEQNTTTQEIDLKKKEYDLEKRVSDLEKNFNGCSNLITSTLNNLKLKVKSILKWKRGKQQWWSNFWGQFIIIVASNIMVMILTWLFTTYLTPSQQNITVLDVKTIVQQVQK